MAKKEAVGFEGFKEFIRKQGVVGFGVALVLGLAVVELVNTVLAALVQPIIAELMGGADVSTQWLVEVGDASLRFGSAFQALLDFVILAGVVYLAVHLSGMDKWDSED